MFNIKMKKRAAMLLSLMLLVCLMPQAAFAAATVAISPDQTIVYEDRATVVVTISQTNSNILAASIEWAKNPNDFGTSAAATGTLTRDATQSFSLTGLTSNTVYYVRALIIYTENNSDEYKTAISTTYPFTTSGGQITGAPSVITISANKTDNIIQANGYISNDGYGSIIDYGFVYSTSVSMPVIGNNASMSVQGRNLTNNNFDATINISGTTGLYYVRAYAKNSHISEPAYGNVITVNLSAPDVNVLLQPVDYIGSDNAQFSIFVPPVQGTTTILDKGIVLAKHPNDKPAIDTAYSIIVSANSNPGNPATGAMTISVSNLEKSTKYYVRAYIKTNNGTFYSSETGVVIDTLAYEDIVAIPVTDITNQTAKAGGKIATNLPYTVQKRGVVVSNTNREPTINNSIDIVHERNESGEYTVEVKNLSPNTTYYVRAYYQTAQDGTTYSKNIQTFKTEDNTYMRINEIIDIKAVEATVKASVLGDKNANITERGVVYSDTQTDPTVSNSTFKAASAAGTGDYEYTITGLTSNVKYYVKAYAKNNSGTYFYSPVKDFTTTTDVITVVTYRTADGAVVGTENVSAPVSSNIANASLHPPEGYTVQDTINHTVTGNGTLDVVVTPAQGVETAYAKGTGGYRFEPDVPMKRVDVAKMLYNLLGGGRTYTSPIIFPDLPSDIEGINAINFCASRGIIVGDERGFGPERGIIRAEMSVILVKAFNMEPNNSVPVNVTDISSHWSRTYVTIAVQNGAITGYKEPDNTYTFRPDRQVTRAEAVTMMCYAVGRSMKPLGTAKFIDVPENEWYYDIIMNAAIPEP